MDSADHEEKEEEEVWAQPRVFSGFDCYQFSLG